MPSDLVKAFGREVRRRRLALNISLETLGEGCGMSPGYVASIENAKRPRGLSLDGAFRIAHALGVSLPELLGFRGLVPESLEVARLSNEIHPGVRAKVADLVRTIAEVGRGRA